MITIIPVQQNVSAWSQRTPLDGVDYQLDFAWNTTAGAWYLSLSDTQGNPIVSGLKLVSNRPLLSRFHFIAGTPPGELSAVDLSGTISYAGLTDLGGAVQLAYFDAAEMAKHA